MRSFACGNCRRLVYFENSLCLNCSSALGFDAGSLEMVAAEATAGPFERCANAVVAGCNWLADTPGGLCRSCRLTRTRPDDEDPDGLLAFAHAEAAKRRVLFQLLDIGLPVEEGRLVFDLLSSARGPVMTGHADGVITLDLAESDSARREARRQQLGEPYRTVLGHLRHELAHYYQPLVVDDWDHCRAVFGDERASYDEALERHYEQGPPADWAQTFVSAYATMHPWEDWAETFAHDLHIRDTLQTAAEFGVRIDGPDAREFDRSLQSTPEVDEDYGSFREVLADWLPLTYALNAVNRSMGSDDLYPFTLAPAVIDKLAYVHELIDAAATPRAS